MKSKTSLTCTPKVEQSPNSIIKLILKRRSNKEGCTLGQKECRSRMQTMAKRMQTALHAQRSASCQPSDDNAPPFVGGLAKGRVCGENPLIIVVCCDLMLRRFTKDWPPSVLRACATSDVDMVVGQEEKRTFGGTGNETIQLDHIQQVVYRLGLQDFLLVEKVHAWHFAEWQAHDERRADQVETTLYSAPRQHGRNSVWGNIVRLTTRSNLPKCIFYRGLGNSLKSTPKLD